MRIFAAKILSSSAIQSSSWVRRPLRPHLRWDWLSRNLFSSLWNERFQQRLEPRAQVLFLAFLLQQPDWIAGGFQRVTQVRQPHQPKRMLEIILTPNVKGDPAGVRNPVVFFGQTFCQERIAESARKWYIDDPPGVDLSDFGTLESEFPTSETMWMNRYLVPCGDFIFKLL